MIKSNHYGALDVSALEVNDHIGYVSPFGTREDRDARAAVVTKVTAKQVRVAWSDTESCTFMRESGRQVGRTSYREARLISPDRMQAAKQTEEARRDFRSTMENINKIVSEYHGKWCVSITEADRNRLESLIASLAVRVNDSECDE